MKLKKIILAVGISILLIVSIFVFNSIKKASKLNDTTLTINDLQQKNFLHQQQAALYASSTSEVLQKGKGNSQVIFIDRKGQARTLKLSGLENGSIHYNQHHLWIEESNQMLLLGNKFNTYHMKSNELRGIQMGYLPTAKQFYSIYNTGFSKKNDYKTVIRYGDENGIRVSSVPYFVSSVGQLSDRIILLTQDLITGKFALQEVQLKKNIETTKILDIPLKNAGDLDALTPIVSNNNNFYFVMTNYRAENREDLELVIINRKMKNVETIPFIKYRTEYQVSNALPYNFNHSASMYRGHFYYINGLGTVYEFNPKTKDIHKALQLHYEKEGNSRFEQVTFKNNFIYHIFSNKKQQFFLETYNLTTKKKLKEQEIQNLNSILPLNDKKYFLTSLEILNDN